MTTVAGFDLKEFDTMINKFEKLKEKSLKNGKQIVNVGAEIILAQQKIAAPRDSGNGAES